MMGGAHLGILTAKRPIFNQRERHRQNYLNDESFRGFQDALMDHPEAGDVIDAYSTRFGHPFQPDPATCSTSIRPGQYSDSFTSSTTVVFFRTRR